MSVKFNFATIALAVIAISVTSCTTNDEEIQTNNLNTNQIENTEAFAQKEGDTLTPNENEPIIVKPRK